MTIPVSSLFTPQTPTQWLAQLLADAGTLGLTSTSWQSGDPILTILQILSVELAKEDAFGVSLRAQGGFLDFAATGTVTMTDINGVTTTVPVTPDPSIPAQNPTGALGLLDTLSSSVFNVKRGTASAATGTVYLANTSGVSLGTFNPGTFHVQNVLTGATYSSQTVFTFSPSSVIGTFVSAASTASPVAVTTNSPHGLLTGAIIYAQNLIVTPDNFYQVTVTGGSSFTLNGSTGAGAYTGVLGRIWSTQAIIFQADQIGPVGNAGIGNINQLVTAAPKCFGGNLVTFAGAQWQSNVSLAATCRAKLATLSPNGPSGAYAYFALSAFNILQGVSILPSNQPQLILTSPIPAPMNLDGGPITRTLVSINTANGIVTTTVANAGGAVGGSINNVITNVTATSPIQITSAAHGLVTGDWAQVNGVQNTTGANGQFQVTFVDANNVTLNGSTGVGAYTVGTGLLSGGDVYAVQAVLQAYSTPNAVTENVNSAGNVTVTITAKVYVPIALVSDYTSKMTVTLQTYFQTFPIGGLNVDNASNVLPLGAIEGLLFASGQNLGTIYTKSVFGVTLNGVAADLSLGTTGVAVLGVLTGISVIGV